MVEKILVTGASGFVGCRVVERLTAESGMAVRAMVHTYARSARVARLDVELVQGDLMVPASLERALSDCHAVVHCAYGNAGPRSYVRRATGRGTANLARLAAEAGIKRFVHISSMVVYGHPSRSLITEEQPYRYTGDAYAAGKIDAEKAVLRTHRRRGLPVAVLRPAIIYGPHSQTWTVAPLQAIKRGEILLVGDGDVPANTINVDNLVDAILLALESDAAVGQCFNISDDDGSTWSALYGAYARMVGSESVPSITVEEYQRLVREGSGLGWLFSVPKEILSLLASSEFRALGLKALQYRGLTKMAMLAHRSLPASLSQRLISCYRGLAAMPPPGSLNTGAAGLPDRNVFWLYTSNVRLDITKARQVLGFRPHIPFEKGIELTHRWAKFARLV